MAKSETSKPISTKNQKIPLLKRLKPTKNIMYIIISLFVTIGTLIFAYSKGAFTPPSPSTIEGIWIEQDVVTQSADYFEIKQGVIFKAGRVIASSFKYENAELSYTKGTQQYKFTLDPNTGYLSRVTPDKAVFKKEPSLEIAKQLLQKLPPAVEK